MKKVKLTKSIVGNRTLIGIVCVVMALVICFGVAPMVNHFSDRKAKIVRMKNHVEAGRVITAEDVEMAVVGAYNLPKGLLNNEKEVIGKKAAINLYPGDYLFTEKLSEEGKSVGEVIGSLDGSKVVLSVSIDGFAEGISGKIESGDILSAVVYENGEKGAYIPPELKYLRVVATTASDGSDKENMPDGVQAVTVTFLVKPEQAELLARYEHNATLHFALVYRGDDSRAEEYIRVQDAYLDGKAGERGE